MARTRRDDRGGIAGLAALLRLHGDAVEADLQRTYGIRLGELGRTLTWRRLGVLVRHLPRDASTVRAQAGDVADWNVTDHLLAAVVDTLAVANWQRSAVNAAQAKRPAPKVPTPVVRPGGSARPARQITGAQMRDWQRRHTEED